MNQIPKKRPGRKRAKYIETYSLLKGEYLLVGKYSKELMQKIGSFVHYFNRVESPKRLTQRCIEKELRIYREN